MQGWQLEGSADQKGWRPPSPGWSPALEKRVGAGALESAVNTLQVMPKQPAPEKQRLLGHPEPFVCHGAIWAPERKGLIRGELEVSIAPRPPGPGSVLCPIPPVWHHVLQGHGVTVVLRGSPSLPGLSLAPQPVCFSRRRSWGGARPLTHCSWPAG